MSKSHELQNYWFSGILNATLLENESQQEMSITFGFINKILKKIQIHFLISSKLEVLKSSFRLEILSQSWRPVSLF